MTLFEGFDGNIKLVIHTNVIKIDKQDIFVPIFVKDRYFQTFVLHIKNEQLGMKIKNVVSLDIYK